MIYVIQKQLENNSFINLGGLEKDNITRVEALCLYLNEHEDKNITLELINAGKGWSKFLGSNKTVYKVVDNSETIPKKHAANCSWEKIDITVTHYDPDGPDTTLKITKDHIYHDDGPNEYTINFNYCPICGCSLLD